jgi:hypothetical protein
MPPSAGAACLGAGIVPALLCVYIRFFVKRSEVWQENNQMRRAQRATAAASGRSGATILTVAGWRIGAIVVAVALFFALKSVGFGWAGRAQVA